MKNQKTLSEVLTRHLRTSARLKKCEEKHYASNAVFFVDQSEETEAEKAIDQWAKENNVNLFVITPDGFEITQDARRITYEFASAKENDDVIAPAAEQIDILDKPNTVLVFKNIHQMQDKRYRRYLLELVNGHRDGLVADDREPTGYKILNGLMFAIATHNKALDLELFRTDAKDSFAQYDFNEFEKENLKMATLKTDTSLRKAANDFWGAKPKFNILDPNGIKACIESACLDFTPRTVIGIHQPSNFYKVILPDSLDKAGLTQCVLGWFKKPVSDINAKSFDKWHNETCEKILKVMQPFFGTTVIHYGKAQKILNITMKAMYCMIDADNYEKHFEFCHMPLDSVILDQWFDEMKYPNKKRTNISPSEKYYKSKRTCWSNIDYDTTFYSGRKYSYTFYVEQIRDLFDQTLPPTHKDAYGNVGSYKGYTPLQAEFFIWSDKRKAYYPAPTTKSTPPQSTNTRNN